MAGNYFLSVFPTAWYCPNEFKAFVLLSLEFIWSALKAEKPDIYINTKDYFYSRGGGGAYATPPLNKVITYVVMTQLQNPIFISW